MIRKINLPEAKYRKSIRVIKRLDNIKPDVEIIHKAIWRIKNKIKERKRNRIY